MRSTIAFFLAALATSADAFTMNGVPPRFSAALSMTAMDKDFTADSGLTVNNIPQFIDNLDVQNFEESLMMLEPLLTNECVGDQCDVFVEEVKTKAAQLVKTMPDDYASFHH